MGYVNVKEYLGMILKVRRKKKVLFFRRIFAYLIMSKWQARPLNNSLCGLFSFMGDKLLEQGTF